MPLEISQAHVCVYLASHIYDTYTDPQCTFHKGYGRSPNAPVAERQCKYTHLVSSQLKSAPRTCELCPGNAAMGAFGEKAGYLSSRTCVEARPCSSERRE